MTFQPVIHDKHKNVAGVKSIVGCVHNGGVSGSCDNLEMLGIST